MLNTKSSQMIDFKSPVLSHSTCSHYYLTKCSIFTHNAVGKHGLTSNLITHSLFECLPIISHCITSTKVLAVMLSSLPKHSESTVSTRQHLPKRAETRTIGSIQPTTCSCSWELPYSWLQVTTVPNPVYFPERGNI